MRRSSGIFAATMIAFVAACAVLLFTFPIVWAAFTGLKSEINAFDYPPSILVPLSFANYRDALVQGNYFSFLGNSVAVVAASLIVSLCLAAPAAYKLAFFPGRRSEDVLFFALSTRFMPGVAVIVPLLLIYTHIGFSDTWIGLIVLYVALDLPILLWLLRSFFRDIPFELIEAALQDDVSHLKIFWHLVLPLSRAGIATASAIVVILSWNEFFLAVNLTGSSAATLPVYMASFLTTQGQNWAHMSAALTLAILPVLVMGLLAARGLARGLMSGALKH